MATTRNEYRADPTRDLEAFKIPPFRFLPPDILEAVNAHNARLEALQEQWASYDEKALAVYRRAMEGPTKANAIQKAKAEIYDHAQDCLEAERKAIHSQEFNELLDKVQEACNAAWNEAIEQRERVEAERTRHIVEDTNGLKLSDVESHRLEAYKAQARQTVPYQQATAAIEERREAGRATLALKGQIEDRRNARDERMRAWAHNELTEVMFAVRA